MKNFSFLFLLVHWVGKINFPVPENSTAKENIQKTEIFSIKKTAL